VFVTCLTIVVIGAVLLAYVGLTIDKDVASEIEVINSGGSKTALVVYQPGLTGFPRDISNSFANGLASSGWRVEITTASSQAPSDLSKYDFLVLAFPIYAGSPGKAVVRYVDRIGDLHGVQTIIIALAAGSPGDSVNTMKQKVEAANGTFMESLTLFSITPNEGNGSATDIAREAGSKIAP